MTMTLLRIKIHLYASTQKYFTTNLHPNHAATTLQNYTMNNTKHRRMTMKTKTLSILLIALVFLVSGCRANISRNSDGSLSVETTVSQQELQEAINASIADPLIKELNVSLQQGYILVTGQRQRLNDATKMDRLNFRLDLGVSNGQLTATVSSATLDGKPIEQSRVDHWNQTIASRIVILGKKRPNASIKSVSVTPEAVTMNWSIAK